MGSTTATTELAPTSNMSDKPTVPLTGGGTSSGRSCRCDAKLGAKISIGLAVAMILVVLPVCIYELRVQMHEDAHIVAWFTGGVFSLMAVIISLLDIASHFWHFHSPVLQRYIIRIMWMVPIYAIESWLSLRFKEYALYIETARECYEAYVIYSFTYLMIYYCAKGDEAAYAEKLATKDPHKGAHIIPFKWVLKQWPLGETFLFRCKAGALQYVVIRILCTFVTFVTHFTGHYCNGQFTHLNCAYIWVEIIVNFSQLWAMYCLVLFYHATQDELAPIRPFPKFLCVKAVVFFSFWQAVAIAGMVKLGWIHATLTYSVAEVSDGLQDFLICIEMFFAAIAHHYYYPWSDVVDKSKANETTSAVKALVESSMPTDVIHDVAVTVKHTTSRHGTPRSSPAPEDGEMSVNNPLHRGAAAASSDTAPH